MQKVFTNVGKQCADCHADIHRRQFGAACQNCHTVNGWQVNANAIRNHLNRFPLIGAHATLQCDDCHVGAASGAFVGLSTACVSCHQRDFQQAAPLNHVAANLPVTCETCHTMDQWQGAKFDHSQFTHFGLTGAHAQLACSACHAGNRFQGTPTECYGCHAQAYASTTNPNHLTAGFPHDCSGCHTTTNWQGATFDHNKTNFRLTGAHISVDCSACHINGRFAGTPTNCAGCHLPDYTKTTNPNHKSLNLSTQCDTCHTTASWQNAKFDHNLIGFPLTGAHVSVACTQCHVGGNYTAISTDCASCHLKDFNNTTNPNHSAASFPTACAMCHTTTAWTGAQFNHNTSTKFPLTGAHVNVACNQCHVNNQFANTPTDCAGCHLKDFNKTTNPNHVTAGFPTDCSGCHTTAQWAGAQFDHSKTSFPLTGAHTTVACGQCHTQNQSALPTNCAGCHMADFNKTTNPNHAATGRPTTCELCHTTATWTNIIFNHTTTGFALTGFHTNMPCTQCHVNNNYSLTSGACFNCHVKDYNGTNNPPHQAAAFPTTCDTCHTTISWAGATFNHNTATKFPLTGAHVNVACNQCHIGGKFAGTPTDCASCHMSDFNKTTNPNHAAAGFPTLCSACHTTTSWAGAQFDHSKTPFPLTGAHVNVACSQCHVNGQFAGLSTACAGCHLKDFQGTNNPNHPAAGFPTTCDTCHTTASWSGVIFNHTTTGFVLTGFHTTLQCGQCHVNGNFSLTSGTCINCHLTDFNNTNNPPHKSAGFPQDCTVCHTTTNWTSATFNHTTTGFALTGFHTTLQCAQCHVNGNFSLTSGACINCHQTDYNSTNNPPHQAAGFPTTCDTCHTTTNWSGATFNHTTTGFALTGFHTTLLCNQCHVNNNFSLTSGACIGCHLADFNNTNSPPHKASGFPQDCTLCHTTTNWTSATFNHSTTGFPLTGFHTTLQCAQCHVNNNYSLNSPACINCHQSDYNSTNNPPHQAAGFPTTCDTCHTTTNWSGATFNHATTGWALTGIHATTPCTSCHVGGNYTLTSTACYGCHQADYQSTTNPNHVAAGFPTTCDTCHTTAGWTGATFNHTWFPVPHHSAKLCTDCHTNSSNYAVFVCTVCHTQAQTDPEHQGIKNYVWNSTNCYACHPNGGGG